MVLAIIIGDDDVQVFISINVPNFPNFLRCETKVKMSVNRPKALGRLFEKNFFVAGGGLFIDLRRPYRC